MAQFSFDIVSEVDKHELQNALDQARKEVATRFDFKGTGTEIAHEGEVITVRSDSEGRVAAAFEVLKDKLVRRKVSLKAFQPGQIEPGGSNTFRMHIDVVYGISDDKARRINKLIKDLPVKVQSQAQGDQVRVMSKKKDDLQAIIKALKEEDFGIPLQFTNYR